MSILRTRYRYYRFQGQHLFDVFIFIFYNFICFPLSREMHKSVLLYNIVFIFIIKGTWTRRDGMILLLLLYTNRNDVPHDLTIVCEDLNFSWLIKIICMFPHSFFFFDVPSANDLSKWRLSRSKPIMP